MSTPEQTITASVRALDSFSGYKYNGYSPTEQQRECARLMIREGKVFRTAALEAGYSQNTADAGPADLKRNCPGFAMALAEESKYIPKTEEVLALSAQALVNDLRNGKSRGLEKTVETLGRMKIYDFMVRNNETNIGILIGVSESLPETAKPIDVFKE